MSVRVGADSRAAQRAVGTLSEISLEIIPGSPGIQSILEAWMCTIFQPAALRLNTIERRPNDAPWR